MKRTGYCGAFREEDVGRQATVMGWVQNIRDMGGVIFIDLRDREGTLQVVFSQSNLSPQDFALVETLRHETVIQASGPICRRDPETYNPRLDTGSIELRASALSILSQAQPLPFQIGEAASVREEVRLQYRFLDLRRPQMLHNLQFRHRLQTAVEEYLNAAGFVAVETPILTKSTPEGARDYLVPSRVHPGSFYALPQSPQIFKQLLMVGGIDKYYQIARCFRDEDLRADRQPEFTQVDMELSFVEQEDILEHLEKLFVYLFDRTMSLSLPTPFLRLTWKEAMDRYGSDKPDLRFGLPILDITDLAARCGFSVFRKVAASGGVVRAINVKGCADFSRGTIEELTQKAQSYGAKGMAWIAVRPDGELYSVLTKYFEKADMEELLRRVDAQPGDFILFCADKLSAVRRILGALRLDLGNLLGLRNKDEYKLLFVTDFPEFAYAEEEGRWTAMHHPFTMPYPEDIPYLLSDPGRVRAQAYDLVLNGVELGSGSIRIHRQDVQQKMFEALGFTDEEIADRFGFLVGAFQYGTPPHGGFAFGLDRLAMLLLGADSIREVIAFPKVKDASCLMTQAPSPVDEEQLKVLGIETTAEAQAVGSGSDSAAGGRGRPGKTHRRRTPKIDVKAVARLARLSFREEELKAMEQDFKAIVDFAGQLEEIDTEGISPMAHVLPVQNAFREDVVQPSYDRAALLANAPSAQEGCLWVPRVVE